MGYMTAMGGVDQTERKFCGAQYGPLATSRVCLWRRCSSNLRVCAWVRVTPRAHMCAYCPVRILHATCCVCLKQYKPLETKERPIDKQLAV